MHEITQRGQPTYFEKVLYTPKELQQFYELSNQYNSLPFFYCKFNKIIPDDLNKFIEIFNLHSANGIRTAPCFEEPWLESDHPSGKNSSWHRPLWQVLDIHIDPELPAGFGQEIIASNYKDIRNEFPHFYQEIFDLFPFKKVWFIKFLQNNREILPHRDTDWNFNLPTSFRSMIYDDNDKPTFYLKPLDKDIKNFVDPPKNLNTFAYNNGNFLHGAEYHGKSKILMVVRGYLDFNKYRSLLEKSLIKY